MKKRFSNIFKGGFSMRWIVLKWINILFSIALVVTTTACAVPNTTSIKTAPQGWAMTTMNENDFMAYFDKNLDSLDPIEGIWTVSQTIEWTNVVSGLKGDNTKTAMYKVAVIRDSDIKYKFKVWVLLSKYHEWVTGLLKGEYIKSARNDIYQETWYKRDFSVEDKNLSLQKGALIIELKTSAEYPINYVYKTIKLKLYPPVKNENTETERD
jgi:hypothetical protein